jgi:transcriptional regulator with XRE-family HTH domain
MKKENTIDKLWEELKELGKEEAELIEISDIVSDVITQLIRARNRRNMTQRDLARITNIKQTQIARVESLQTNPTLKTLAKYAYHVGGTIDFHPKYDNNYVHITMDMKYSTKSFSNTIKYDNIEYDESMFIQEDCFTYEQ